MNSGAIKAWMLAAVLTASSAVSSQGGSIVRLFYDGITGTAVTNLTASSAYPKYPDGADDSEIRTDFFEGSVGANGVDNFGSLMRGWITAPQTGNYIFWLCSDDQSELWLSPDASVANKKWIAQEPVGNASRDYDSTTRRNAAAPENRSNSFTNNASLSTPWAPYTISLIQGQQYYVEVIHKEGTGGDNVSVGWELPDGTRERPIRGVHLMTYNPTNTPLAITTQPADVSVTENQPATFFVTFQAVPPVTFQWYRNGAAIAGATLPFYTIPTTVLEDNNAQFKVDVTAGGRTVTSEEHTLRVGPDTTAPSVISARTRGNPNAVQIQYSEPVDDVSALTLANYSLSGNVTINSVVKATNDFNALVYQLNTSTMVPGRLYTVTANNIKDLAKSLNQIQNGKETAFYLLTGVITRNFYDIPTGGSITALTNSAAFLNNQPISQSSASAIGWASTMSIGVSGRTTVAGADFSYGSELIGYLIPPLSGLYTFFLATDDSGRLFLSTDSNPANKQLIAQELTWNNRRNWTGHGGPITIADPATGRIVNQSVPIQLTAGAKYFIQSLQAENSSGDNHEVGWQLPSDSGPPANGPLGEVQGYALSSYNTLGPVTITNLVGGNLTVSELGSATWRVYADGSTPFTYQWQKAPFSNPTAFANLNQAGYDFRPNLVQLTDAGIYRVIVSNWFSAATSGPVALTVKDDPTKPTLINATADSTYHRISVEFSEAVTERSQTNLANYALTGGLTVTNVIRFSTTKSVLQVAPLLTAGTEYVLTVRNLQDLSATPNTMDATNVSVVGWVMSRGVAAMHVYNGTTNPSTLGANPKFLSLNPDDVGILTSFNSRDYYPDDSHDNYASSNWALLYPPITGEYRFFVRGDDRAQLYLSSDSNPTNAIQIASAVGQDVIIFRTDPAVFQVTQGASAPVTLTAGSPYFIYILLVESTRADYSAVGWRIPGEDLGDVTDLQPIPGAYLAAPAPTQNASVTFTQQPLDITAPANQPVLFSASASANSAFSAIPFYQWQRGENGGSTFTNILAAVSNTYTIQYPNQNDDGAQFRLIASIANVSATSRVARLTVTADTRPPHLLAAVSTDGASFTLIFDEPIGPGATYLAFPGITVNSATPRATAPQIVDVKTSSLVLGNVYTLAGFDIADLAGNRSSFVVTAVAQSYAANPAKLITLTDQGMVPRGSVSITESLRGFHLNNNFLGTNQPNTLAYTEEQFRGLHGPNLLATNATNVTFNGVVNWDGANPPTVQGRTPGETQFPDLLAAHLADLSNHSVEILCYVDLSQGIHRWGINSDDSFRLANNPTLRFDDLDQIVLAQFEGARGTTETRFDFVVPQDGLYPFRLIYAQGTGPSSLEWWEKAITQDDPNTGPWLLINGTNGGSKAYQADAIRVEPPPPLGPLRLTRAGESFTLSWDIGGQSILESTMSVAGNAVWIPVSATNGSYTATFSSTNQFFRLRK